MTCDTCSHGGKIRSSGDRKHRSDNAGMDEDINCPSGLKTRATAVPNVDTEIVRDVAVLGTRMETNGHRKQVEKCNTTM